VHFFGLFGPNGPLPLHLTDYARRRALGQKDPVADVVSQMQGKAAKKEQAALPSGRKDTTLSAFLDIFHHRLVSLFFRAWACQQQTVDFDRTEDQRFPLYLGSFLGLANEADGQGGSACSQTRSSLGQALPCGMARLAHPKPEDFGRSCRTTLRCPSRSGPLLGGGLACCRKITACWAGLKTPVVWGRTAIVGAERGSGNSASESGWVQ
jgi:hypothetical protein